jgi:hypothetical protein
MKALLIALLFAPLAFADGTPGDAKPMPPDYWSAKHASGVIAIAVGKHIQAFVFISVDGKRMVIGADHCGHVKKCSELFAALSKEQHADIIHYEPQCEEEDKPDAKKPDVGL